MYHYYDQIVSDTYTVVVDESAVPAVTGLSGAAAARTAAALRSGKVVAQPRYLHDGAVSLVIVAVSFEPGADKDGERRTVSAPGYPLPGRARAPIVMMNETTARSLRLDSVPSIALATTSRMPTIAEQDRLHAALGQTARLYVERGPKIDSATRSLTMLAALAGLITLGATAIATGLAAAEGRADLATLAAVGAAPRLRRTLSLSQSGVIAGLGSLLGTAAGLGASIAVLAALNRGYADVWPAPTPYPIGVPWLNVVVALLVVPLVAMLGAGLLTRSRLPIERRQ
jgi:putative ABC transport system permease protein